MQGFKKYCSVCKEDKGLHNGCVDPFTPLINKEPVSNCCKASMRTHSGMEGTGYYSCSKCGNPCNLASMLVAPLPKEHKDKVVPKKTLSTNDSQLSVSDIIVTRKPSTNYVTSQPPCIIHQCARCLRVFTDK